MGWWLVGVGGREVLSFGSFILFCLFHHTDGPATAESYQEVFVSPLADGGAREGGRGGCMA